MWITNFYCVFLLCVGVDDVISKSLGNGQILSLIQPFNQTVEAENNDEIVGGDVVDIKQYPYQVSVLYHGLPFCGGSILSQDFVLSAAHCLGTGLQLHVGSSFVKDGGIVYDVAESIIHPKYSRSALDYDIGILRSTTKIVLDGITTAAVRLPDSTSDLKEGDNVITTGWGRIHEHGNDSNQLRAVTVPVISRQSCSKVYHSIDDIKITERMVCAGLKEGGKDACSGDSGGPLVEEKSLVQYGIVSFGIGCAREGIPGVYSYIPPFRDWIKQVTGV